MIVAEPKGFTVWEDVPEGALIVDAHDIFTVKRRNPEQPWVYGTLVRNNGLGERDAFARGWVWCDTDPLPRAPLVLIATGLSGEETLDELEKVINLHRVMCCLFGRPSPLPSTRSDGKVPTMWAVLGAVTAISRITPRREVAEMLLAAGWHPDMGGAEGARLLEQAQREQVEAHDSAAARIERGEPGYRAT